MSSRCCEFHKSSFKAARIEPNSDDNAEQSVLEEEAQATFAAVANWAVAIAMPVDD